MAIVEGCPAFSDGCPFSPTGAVSEAEVAAVLPEIMKSLPADLVNKCPAFQDGCPFKAEDSVESLYNHMSEMPASHRLQGAQKSSAALALETTFRRVHEKSQELKAKMKATCPVFATSCPFKTLTSAGEPLVAELDLILDQWGLASMEAMAPVTPKPGEGAAQLSQSLKAGTKTVHRAAENVRFVRDFLKGAVPKDSYVELLKALYFVYAAMEEALARLPARLQHIDFGAVHRAESLEEDLRFYLGVPPGAPLDLGEPSPATGAYVARLEELAANEPHLVLAHAYARYLGDLSGGQILARAAKKAYGLEGGRGQAFYRFERVGTSPAEVKEFKRSYRTSLDGLRLSAGDADGIVAEAGTAFLMNMLLFEERDVAAGHLARARSLEEVSAMVTENTSALKFQAAYGGKSGGVNKCPFLPADDPRQPQGEGEAKPAGVCPWPFLWLHAPREALVAHPVKNVCGAAALGGLGVALHRRPGLTGAGLLAASLVAWKLKPKKRQG